MTTTHLSFTPIDLDRHAEVCVRFRRDSFICSFGTDDAFVTQSGSDGGEYLLWLRDRIAALPEGCVHVWDGDTIIGQMEMCVRDASQLGYVFLFYLTPAARGRGAGDQLHDYALSLFQRLAVPRIQLSVSPTNRRAVAYYEKHGWKDLGPRPGHADVHLMELILEADRVSREAF